MGWNGLGSDMLGPDDVVGWDGMRRMRWDDAPRDRMGCDGTGCCGMGHNWMRWIQMECDYSFD